jgi:hypothetical protein
MAQHGSQSSPGALAFLTVQPTTDLTRSLESSLWREACRKVMGLERPVAEGFTCHHCKGQQSAEHARRCNTGEQNYRHHTLVKVLSAALTQEGGLNGVERETAAPFAGAVVPGIMDIVVPAGEFTLPHTEYGRAGGSGGPRAAMLDITIHDPWEQITTPACRSGARTCSGIWTVGEVFSLFGSL